MKENKKMMTIKMTLLPMRSTGDSFSPWKSLHMPLIRSKLAKTLQTKKEKTMIIKTKNQLKMVVLIVVHLRII